MVKVKIIAVGNIREAFFTDACAEYMKRLGAFCAPQICEIREAKLPEKPSAAEIGAALADEGKRILEAVPARAFCAALAIEGKEMSSEELSELIETQSLSHPALCFIIGSSYGLAPVVKRRADLLVSFSRLTFPHRLFRVMLLESLYRSFTIIRGTGYHK